MDSKLARLSDGIIEAGWLAALVATPLFFNIHSARVFEPDKLTLLRSIAVVMAAAWLVKFLARQEWRDLRWLAWRGERSIWRIPFAAPVALLVLVYLVSTIFSVTPVVSWAGSYQRLQGTYTTLAYIVIFALMAATIRRREQVSRVVTTAIVVSIPVALYAMLQHYELDPLPWGGDTQRRVAGHMGNSIFIGAYLIMVVPLTLARIIDAFTNILNDDELATADIIRSSIYIFALAAQLITIYWTRSRGPFLGLTAGIYAFVLIMLVTLRNADPARRRFTTGDLGRAAGLALAGVFGPLLIVVAILARRFSALQTFGFFVIAIALVVVGILVLAVARRAWRWLWLSWIMLAVALAGLLLVFNIPAETARRYQGTPVIGDTLETMQTWRSLPEIGRFGQLLESEEGTGRVRVLIWEGVLDLIGPHEPLQQPDGSEDRFNFLRPIIGYGPESMYVAYNRFYPPELATIEARNASPDRSHNETFDALVITGIAGFLAWQLVYLSAFYHGFRWLGVVKSRRDRNVLIGLWIGGAAVGGAAITAAMGPPFLGVAIPFGTIAGLVLYLIYYAITTSGGEETDADPFNRNRLLLIAIVAAMLAHYVEIHFGIAIAATRTYFFAYLAVLYLVGAYLPAQAAAPVVMEEAIARVRRRGRPSRPEVANRSSAVWVAAAIMTLIVGTLAFNVITFALPPGEAIESAADVPTTGEILRQSFFVNAKENFSESPFIFLMIVLSWALGSILFLSEMAREGILHVGPALGRLSADRLRIAALLFAALAVGAVAAILLPGSEEAPGSRLLAAGLLLLGAVAAAMVAFGLFRDRPWSRPAAGVAALAALALAVPLVVAGITVPGFALAAAGTMALYLLWDPSWNEWLLPAAIVALISILVGMVYAVVDANMIRGTFLLPSSMQAALQAATEPERRVLEAGATASVLTVYYAFFFAVLLAAGWMIGRPALARARSWGPTPALVGALLMVPLAAYVISTSNLRVIQADIVYKRADPWDKQATRNGDAQSWDNAIAIYERAIDLAPTEDYYYLFLGRAYLERSGVDQDVAERERLLETAESQLEQAQRINPLNTDHTVNLARLNTRWADIVAEAERLERIAQAEDYYQRAIALSPFNAVIRNEYARLAYLLQDDCEAARSRYTESIAQDPFYATTYFERGEILKVCAERVEDEATRIEYLNAALTSLEEGLAREPDSVIRWLLLAEVHLGLGYRDAAVRAYEEATARRTASVPQWQIDYTFARSLFEAGEAELAGSYAELALAAAPADAAAEIQRLVDDTAGGAGG